jgi:Subtilase family
VKHELMKRAGAVAAAVLALAAIAGPSGAQAVGPVVPGAAPPGLTATSPQQLSALRTQLRSGTLGQTHGVAMVCGERHLRCLAQALTTGPGSHAKLVTGQPIGYGATELQAAYGVTGGGRGTIAVLGAGAYPSLESDLTIYRDTYGLPRCTTANGCLTIVNHKGGAPRQPTLDEWGQYVEESVAVETALDVDMASAACPRCKIIVGQLPWQDAAPETLEAEDVATDHFATGVQTAVRLGADAVSISYGYDTTKHDLTGSSAKRMSQKGVAVFAASGDSGFLGDAGLWPQSLPTVVSAGGTSLYSASNERGYTDVAWGGAGSGCTPGVGPAVGQPRTVSATCGGSRAASDISAVADPYTGVAVYDSYSPAFGFPPGFLVVGGTSASSPFLAGLAARAGVPAKTLGPNTVYGARPGRVIDVTLGQNAPPGACGQFGYDTRLCVARTGWDGPTGVGVPAGIRVFSGR